MISNFEFRRLQVVDPGAPAVAIRHGVAVTILLTADRRLSPAQFARITAILPAALWPIGNATVSIIIGTRNQSTLVNDNGIIK